MPSVDLRFIINTQRRLLKWTPYKLAKEADVPLRAVYYFLDGTTNGSGVLIGKLMDALGLVVEQKWSRSRYAETWEQAASRLPPEQPIGRKKAKAAMTVPLQTPTENATDQTAPLSPSEHMAVEAAPVKASGKAQPKQVY